MRLIFTILVFGAALPGCVAGGKPPIADLGSGGQAVVDLSDIMSNIKCDMLMFVKDNRALGGAGTSFGGVITYTLGRTREIGGEVKFGIPIAATKLEAAIGANERVAHGQTVKTPFYIEFDPNARLADCESKRAAGVRVFEKGGEERRERLNGPILGLGELRNQIDRIVPDEPRITFTDFVFTGSAVLTRSQSGSAGIDIVIIKPSITANATSEFKIDYEIGTNWKSIFKKAEFDTRVVVPPTPAPKPTPTQIELTIKRGAIPSDVAGATPTPPQADRPKAAARTKAKVGKRPPERCPGAAMRNSGRC